MSSLSDDRINYLAHQIHTTLTQGGKGHYANSDRALKDIKRVLIDSLKADEAIDATVRDKITRLKRGVVEGSPEWEILYRKYFEEELSKKNIE